MPMPRGEQLPPPAARWVYDGVPLALAPSLGAAHSHQFARARVSVTERTVPEFALVFDAKCTVASRRVDAARGFTKRQLAAAFELSVAQDGGATTDALGVAIQQENARRDRAVRRWLQGGGKIAPPAREELAKWLLSRMFLKAGAVEWRLFLAGEEELEVSAVRGAEPLEAAASVVGGGSDNEIRSATQRSDHDRRAAWGEEDGGDVPPGYEVSSCEPPTPSYGHQKLWQRDGLSNDDDDNDDDDDIGNPFAGGDDNGDESLAPPAYQLAATGSGSLNNLYRQPSTKADIDAQNAPAMEHDRERSQLSARENRAASTASAIQRSSSSQQLTPPSKSTFAIEPASLRLRRRSMTSDTFANEWTEDRRMYELELTTSKRDIENAKRDKERAQRVADLRKERLLQAGRRKVAESQQRRRDAHCVKELITDTIEYHTVRLELDAQIKQTKTASQRELERAAQCMRVAIGRTDKWKKGCVLGPGPLSQREIDLSGKCRSNSQPYDVYDLHGRRHSLSEAGRIAAKSDFESAMTKIQRSLIGNSKAVEMFRKYDRDRTGALSYAEFLHLMKQQCGVSLSSEQSSALFRHFDPNCSGEIDYGELLWGFFNRQAFLKRWEQKRSGLSDREVKMRFYRYDRTGRGALSMTDFLLALDDMGFRVSEAEAKLLCVKFDMDGDGFVNYDEFCRFVRRPTGENDSNVTKPSSQGESTSGDRHPAREIRVVDKSEDDAARILAELQQLRLNQEHIRRSVSQ